MGSPVPPLISMDPSNSETVAAFSVADTLKRVPLMTATRKGVSMFSLCVGRFATL